MSRRIMFIFWKWDNLEGKKWDIFPVEGSDTDLIIRITENGYPEMVIEQEIKHQLGSLSDAKVLWFVHYTKWLKLNKKIKQTALFSNNRPLNKIYDFSGGENIANVSPIFFTGNTVGFLAIDDKDFFQGMRDVIKNTENGSHTEVEYISVLNEKLDKLLFKYFDNTWHYYEHNFKKKITELFDDLSHHLLDVPNHGWNNQEHSADVWIDKLVTDRLLHLRVKSFFNIYTGDTLDDPILRGELQVLQKEEKEKGVSYIFDNCHENLKQGQLQYQKLYETLHPIFIRPNPEERIKWESIEQLFQALLINLN